jgi:hypothetical protein
MRRGRHPLSTVTHIAPGAAPLRWLNARRPLIDGRTRQASKSRASARRVRARRSLISRQMPRSGVDGEVIANPAAGHRRPEGTTPGPTCPSMPQAEVGGRVPDRPFERSRGVDERHPVGRDLTGRLGVTVSTTPDWRTPRLHPLLQPGARGRCPGPDKEAP